MSCEAYRTLNAQIGKDIGWVDRQIMPENDLKELLSDPDLRIILLWHNGEIVGFGEFTINQPGIISLDYFGLIPEFRGKRLGKPFLLMVLQEAWKINPNKIILNTCENDHPLALPMYLNLGFTITDIRQEEQACLVP